MEIFDSEGALSKAYLLKQGKCCNSGCKNCPYLPKGGKHTPKSES